MCLIASSMLPATRQKSPKWALSMLNRLSLALSMASTLPHALILYQMLHWSPESLQTSKDLRSIGVLEPGETRCLQIGQRSKPLVLSVICRGSMVLTLRPISRMPTVLTIYQLTSCWINVARLDKSEVLRYFSFRFVFIACLKIQ